MTDHDPTYTQPPMPSIGDTMGLRVNNTLAEHDAKLSELALALCCLDAALAALNTGGISCPTFQTDNRRPATITRVGNNYEVRRRV